MVRIGSAAFVLALATSIVGCGGSTTTYSHVDAATWCDSVQGGPSGTREVAVDLSAAHAGVRWFAAELDGGTADQALSTALTAPDALTDAGITTALTRYKSSLLQVCVLPADDRPIPPASVEMKGAVAVIHPGTGTFTLPANAAAVAIDLRDLPNRPGLDDVLRAAVAPALAGSAHRGGLLVAENYGLPPELADYQGFYGHTFETVYPLDFTFTGGADLPLAVITGKKMGPDASEFAATLRLLQKAWIFGEDLRIAVAESCWQGVGDHGVAYRCRELGSGTHRWPDVIPADSSTDQLDGALQALAARGPIPEVPSDRPADRPLLQVVSVRPEPSAVDLGSARAAVITAHGAATTFNPDPTTGTDALDNQLLASLGTLGATPDRATALTALQQMTAPIADGQAFVTDVSDTNTDRLPLVFDLASGEPVVRASGDSGVHPGDKLTQVNGVDFATWYAQQAPALSAGTDSYRMLRALDVLTRMSSATLTLADSGGTTRTATVTAQPSSAYTATRSSVEPASGLLSGTNYYYLNADASQLASNSVLASEMQTAASADGLILDLRGMPSVSSYDIAAAVVTHSFKGPLFHVPVWHGHEAEEDSPVQGSFPPATYAFPKKVVVLVGPSTVGNAELAATAIYDSVDYGAHIKLVGRNTAGTAGLVSAIVLPGNFDFGFTSMDMHHSDDSPFERIGLAPDVTASPTQADLAAGVDTELQAAKTTLDGM